MSEVLVVDETVKEEAPATSSLVKEDPSSIDRPPSPDSSCPICLDAVNSPAFVEQCFHRFCFDCLFQWSQVKPECPLCKSRFSFIVHNVRSLGDYDIMPVGIPPTLDNFFISVAFQRPRFVYSSPPEDIMNNDWRLNDITAIQGSTPSSPSMSASITAASDWRRRRQASAVEFRRLVYRQNQWVKPARNLRVRETSPSFYRENPAQVHRLVPWLNRELSVLLDVRFDSVEVCWVILHSIKDFHIKSTRFYRVIWPYLGMRSEHFIHEFYNFAISPFDMLAYDLHSEYSVYHAINGPLSSDIEIDNDVMIIEPPPVEPIEISDTDDVVTIDGEESISDSSVTVIGSLPPISQREPDEVIILDDSDNNEEQEEEEEEEEGNLFMPSMGDCSTSCHDEDNKDEIRLRSGLRPYYKEDSSSESDYEPRKRRTKRKKHKERKRKPMKPYSSSDEDDIPLSKRCSTGPLSPAWKPPSPFLAKNSVLSLPRLKSVVRRVNRDGAGCSTWQSGSS